MMYEKPRIMVLAPDLPYPVHAGGQVRMASMVRALAAKASVHIACIAPDMPPQTLAWAGEIGATIVSCARPPAPAHLRALRWCGQVLRGHNLVFHANEWRFFDAAYRDFQPSVVWLETPYLMRYAVRWAGRSALAVDYWGTSQGALREYRNAATRARRLRYRMQWHLARNGERIFAPVARAVIAVSELDAGYFRGLCPGGRVWAIPDALTEEARGRARLAAAAPVEPGTLIMTGDMGYRPNIDAACRFVSEILPLIKAQVPDVRFLVVGRDPSSEVRALSADPCVRVVGYVEDLAASIAGAAVYVLPMRLGSGVRSKLLEVFALGKPLVTTSTGAEGLELRHQDNCLIAETPEDFAGACLRLLRDQELSGRLGRSLRRLADDVYTQENVERMVAEVIRYCVAG